MSSEKRDIVNRLKRIEGQIKGLQKMIEEQKDCSDILMQVAAARSALNKAGNMIFVTHFKDCVEKSMEEENRDNFSDNLTYLLDKYIK